MPSHPRCGQRIADVVLNGPPPQSGDRQKPAVVPTAEDRKRSEHYVAERLRNEASESFGSIDDYLTSLDMRALVIPLNDTDLLRVVQLLGKTNQFNLRTQRYTEPEIKALMLDPNAFGLQFRLVDRFGDNGIVAIVIGKVDKDRCFHIDTWLMSCRVLGRQVEQATLNIIAAEAIKFGTTRLLGEYIATRKNGIVKDFYPRLGFQPDASRGGSYSLDLQGYVLRNAAMKIAEVPQ